MGVTSWRNAWRRFATAGRPRVKLSAVQQTSLMTAYWRACETRSSKPLCKDPYAELLVAALLDPSTRAAHDQSPMRSDGVGILAVRTRVVDDWLERVVASRTPKGQQVVFLGAGMDTRAYRVALGESTVLEVDSDVHVLNAKQEVLSLAGVTKTCGRVLLVQADLADPAASADALLAAGLRADAPTHWVLEGLVEYLPRHTHHGLYAMAARLGGAPGSTIAVQVLEPSWAERLAELNVALPYADELAPVEETVSMLEAAGWDPLQVLRRPDFEEMYDGRTTHPGFTMAFATRNGRAAGVA